MRISDWSSDVCSSDLADRVAAVERALRPAQHLDPLDVVYVEHRGLRAVQINVVEIDADACLETRHRILLADAADERGERRVGAARRLERDVGRSEEHTSELQSLMRISYAVFCLKKKNKQHNTRTMHRLLR